MTRQQRRLSERTKAKQAKSEPKIVSKTGPSFYGAFYQDDKEDGFCLVLDKNQFKNNEWLINTLISTHDNMVKDYEMLPEDVQRDEVSYQKTILRQNIDKFNEIAFPNGRVGLSVDIPEDAYQYGIMAASSIHFLTTIGEIPNDNFNGMHFMYEDFQIANV